MSITDIFQQKKQVVSFEIFPPKQEHVLKNIDGTLTELARLHPDFISVTFGAGGTSANNKTVELASKIKIDYHIEPVVHLTCLNYSKDEIREFLTVLQEKGIRNILALRGDRNPDIEPKKDFLYASELVSYIQEFGGFHVSAACYPEVHLEAANALEDMKHLKEKVDAGANHLISQLFFDNDKFYKFYENSRMAGITVPIEAGIMPVTNRKQIERMVNTCGATLPDKFKKIIEKYETRPQALMDAGIAYAINQIVDLLAHDVDGIHIYTMNNPYVAKKICDGIKNLI